MITDIKTMPTESRIWIYQASRQLNPKEIDIFSSRISAFLENWAAHGHSLKASWDLFYDQFIVIAADANYELPSGCSIDKSVNFLKEMEIELGIQLLDRSSVATIADNAQINIFDLKDLKKSVSEGKIKPDTLIFNNLIQTLGELNESWKIPASNSWVSRYFNN